MHLVSASGAAHKNGSGGRQAMAKSRLTRRGKIVIAILFITVWGLLLNGTTPDQCKVPVDQMSQFCIDLIYP
jgi:hypothetical protein